MAESHTYLSCVHSNNALVTNYYQSGKGERGESRDWEVCSLGVGDGAHSKCDVCGSRAGSVIRICNQGQGFYQSYTMVWYVSYLQEYWRFLQPRASGDPVCFQVVMQGNQNTTYIDTSMHYLMCTLNPPDEISRQLSFSMNLNNGRLSALLKTNEFTKSRLWDGAKGRTVSAGSIVYIAIVIQ